MGAHPQGSPSPSSVIYWLSPEGHIRLGCPEELVFYPKTSSADRSTASPQLPMIGRPVPWPGSLWSPTSGLSSPLQTCWRWQKGTGGMAWGSKDTTGHTNQDRSGCEPHLGSCHDMGCGSFLVLGKVGWPISPPPGGGARLSGSGCVLGVVIGGAPYPSFQ
jgi:hypothetical protein